MKTYFLAVIMLLGCAIIATAQQYPKLSVDAKDKLEKQYHPPIPRLIIRSPSPTLVLLWLL